MAREKALPLSENGISVAAESLGIGLPEVWAILKVETSGCGFLSDKRPKILFERHIFHKETGGKFDAAAPDLSNKQRGGYGAGGANQHIRLERAAALDRSAALRSASWGIGQVMGFNAEMVGFSDIEAMVAAMHVSEDEQLGAMLGFIRAKKLRAALQRQDWAVFARRYNGPKFAENEYDKKLDQAVRRYSTEGVPDVAARAAQVYLLYRGFNPGGIDGVLGKKSRAALRRFQDSVGLPPSGKLDNATVAALAR